LSILKSYAYQEEVGEGALFERSSPELDVVASCCVVMNSGLVVCNEKVTEKSLLQWREEVVVWRGVSSRKNVRNDTLLGAQKARSI
jgi:hypothetical protein